MTDRIEGRNPVMEALLAGREIEKIYVSGSEGSIRKIIGMARDRKIPVSEVSKSRLDEMCETKAHQGVIAVITAHSYATVDDIIKRAKDKNEPLFVVILDEITDPHNLGSVLRTANGAGVHGIIIPKRNSVGLTGTVAKTSVGAVEYTPVARVSNIGAVIDRLKEEGVWFYAAHQDAEQSYCETDYSGGVGLVIGNEGKGISRLVKEKCDFLLSIPMLGEINSLNASVAAGILMYEVVRFKEKKK